MTVPDLVEQSMLVEIWSDVVCPWCYIGKRRFEAALRRFEHADEVEVRWRSFELDPHAPRSRPGRMAEHLATKYAMSVAEAEQRLEGLNRLAAAEGLHYDLARTQGGNTLGAHRLIHLAYEQSSRAGAQMKEALLEAYFVDLKPVGDPDVLAEVAVSVGLDADEVASLLGSDRFTAEVRRDEAEAAALGCTGVPFFVIDRAFAVPGAQDVDTFLVSLQRAWARSHPGLATVPGSGGGSCSDGACQV